jgi:hypothetical protein
MSYYTALDRIRCGGMYSWLEESMALRLNSDSRFTGRSWTTPEVETTDLPPTLWPSPFNHVLSADTKFRYASRSKFLSSGFVITVGGARQYLALFQKGMLRSFELLLALCRWNDSPPPSAVFICGGMFFFANSSFAFCIKDSLCLYSFSACAALAFAFSVLWWEKP